MKTNRSVLDFVHETDDDLSAVAGIINGLALAAALYAAAAVAWWLW